MNLEYGDQTSCNMRIPKARFMLIKGQNKSIEHPYWHFVIIRTDPNGRPYAGHVEAIEFALNVSLPQ